MILPVDVQRNIHRMLDAFDEFVAERAPDDLEVMYADTMRRQPATTEDALALWQQHVDDYTTDASPAATQEPSE